MIYFRNNLQKNIFERGPMFAKISIKAKLLSGFGLMILFILILSLVSYFKTHQLSTLQDEGASRAKDAIKAQEISKMPSSTYRIIADTVINRNFE